MSTCSAVACLAWMGCARPVMHPEPIPALPIDLEPRCLEAVEGSMARSEAIHVDLRDRRVERAKMGALWIAEETASAGMARLQWGFPLENDAPEEPMSLAAALMTTGDMTAAPVSFRGRLLEIGGKLEAEAKNGWLWLEIKFPESALPAAYELMERWLSPVPAGPSGFAQARRRVGLLRMAQAADPTGQARRLFVALHADASEIHTAVRAESASEPETALTPESVASLLANALDHSRSVVIFQGQNLQDAHDRWVRTFDAVDPRNLKQTTAGLLPSASRQADEPGPGTSHREPFSQSIEIIDRPGSPHAELLVGYPTVAASHPDAVAFEMWATLLGGNVGGRLFRDLRERQGLAYIINAEQQVEGQLIATTRGRNERVVALLKGIELHFAALTDRPLLDCERQMLVARMRGEWVLESEDGKARADRLRNEVEALGAPRAIPDRLESFDRAVRGDLERVAKRYLSARPTMVVVGDADWLAPDLEAAFPNRTVRRWDSALSLQESGE